MNENRGVNVTSQLGDEQVDEIQRQLRELAFLHETSQVLTATLDLESVLRSLMTQVRDYFRVDAVSIALWDEEAGELVFRVAVGDASDSVVGMRLSPDQGVAGWVLRTGEPTLVPVASADERFYDGIDEMTGFQTQAMLAVPIKIEGRTTGVIEVLNPAGGTFTHEAQRLLLSVADLAAVGIRNAELFERTRQAERRYESLFEGSSDPILVLDLEGRVLNLNQRAIRLLGRPREQLIGTAFCELIEADRETCQSILEQVRQGRQQLFEVGVQSEDGLRILETHMVKIDYGGREAIQWLGHDVSERVALEQMREDLRHMIVHDLRNPLGSIMSSLQLIRTAFVERDQTLPVMKLISIAMRSGEKLYRLIDSLLDLGRLEAGETELNRVSTDPAFLVREAVEQLQPLALSKKQTLEAQVSPGLPSVCADRDLIVRVLTNLLDNAVKFTPKDGRIILRVKRSQNQVLFSVSDTGPGIRPEYHQRIFDRFTRLKDADGLHGTGLGLAFCKLAVEAHGGRIWVESAVGRGADFKFVLPMEAIG